MSYADQPLPVHLPQVSPDSFKGETLFITGCSGFLGKVILEKVMRSFNCDRIYVLLRPKKGQDVATRFRAGLLGSRIFESLRATKGASFDQWASELVIPIAGDLLSPGIGMSSADRSRLASSLSVIIHSAASVEFDLPIDEATKINVDGSLEVLALARECSKLKSFVHVSTCYVNSNRRGFVRETIYPCPYDPAEMYSKIKSMSPAELARDKAVLTEGWPNTYTFTKFLTEHLLVANKGTVPLMICRPSIIAASLTEPAPGWTDSISAASAVFLAVGMGICPVFPGSCWNVADVVPVDLCSNMIILAAAMAVGVNGQVSKLSVCHCTSGRPEACTSLTCRTPVVHCGTSSLAEPMTWFAAVDTLGDYFTQHPPPRQILSSSITIVSNRVSFAVQRFIHNRLPRAILRFLEFITGGNIKMIRDLHRAFKAGDKVVNVFSFFTENEWVFESDFTKRMSPSDEVDPLLSLHLLSSIDWNQYIHTVCYGMRKFCLGETHADLPRSVSLSGDALQRAKAWKIEGKDAISWGIGSDLVWAKSGVSMDYSAPGHSELEDKVLATPAVTRVMQMLSQAGSATLAHIKQQAAAQIHSIGSRFDHTSTRFFGWGLQKLFASMYDRVSVNEDVVETIKQLDARSAETGPILLLPTHRSYMDFLMLSYILFAYHVKVPFIAAGEDFQKIPGVNAILRQSGAFFMKRRMDARADPLYVAVFKAYFQQVIRDHGMVEFFVEGTRSRTGVTMNHKNGLLSFAMELLFEGVVPDLHFVPVSMSYERVLEAGSFPPELMGEAKEKETLSRIVKAVSVIGTKYGRANVVFDKPISVKQWIALEFGVAKPLKSLSVKERFEIVNRLGRMVTDRLDAGLTVMSTHLVGGVLLNGARHAPMKETELIKQVEWLRDEVRERGGILDVPLTGSCVETVRHCLKTHFESLVLRNRDSVVIRGSSPHELKTNILMLAYYRNQLLGMFRGESVVALSMLANASAWTTGVAKSDLVRDVSFISVLMGHSFESDQAIDLLITHMLEMGTLTAVDSAAVDQHVRLDEKFAQRVAFLGSVLYPTVDAVWVCATGLGWRKPNMDLNSSMQVLAKSLYEEKVIRMFESCTTEAVKAALHAFTKAGLIDKAGNSKVENFDKITARIARFRREAHTGPFSTGEDAGAGRFVDGTSAPDLTRSTSSARL